MEVGREGGRKGGREGKEGKEGKGGKEGGREGGREGNYSVSQKTYVWSPRCQATLFSTMFINDYSLGTYPGARRTNCLPIMAFG